MKKLKKGRVYQIYWIDSVSMAEGWVPQFKLKQMQPSKIETVGYLIDKDKNYITIVSSISKYSVLGRVTIPKCSITKIKRL